MAAHDGGDLAGIMSRLGCSDIESIMLGLFDWHTCFRAKRLSVERFAGCLEEGYRFPRYIYNWDAAEKIRNEDTSGDCPVTIDLESVRVDPLQSSQLIAIAEMSGDLGPVDPRGILRQQIARAERLGFRPVAAFEYEFTLLNEDAASLRAKAFDDLEVELPDNRTYSAISQCAASEFINRVCAVAATLGIATDSVLTEFGGGSFEIPLRHQPAIRAADDAALFRNYVKAVARKQGKTATFMSRWHTEREGQSGHIHFSLTRSDTGCPVFRDPDSGEDSELLGRFVAGVLELLPTSLAMCAHTVNAYRRFVPGQAAPTSATWGEDNRTTAIRLIGHNPSERRIEFRVPAADSNPYLSLALLLGGGLNGIERKLEPDDPVLGDAGSKPCADWQRLPSSLMEAAHALASDDLAHQTFGAEFCTRFSDGCRWEVDAFRDLVTNEERRRYMELM